MTLQEIIVAAKTIAGRRRIVRIEMNDEGERILNETCNRHWLKDSEVQVVSPLMYYQGIMCLKNNFLTTPFRIVYNDDPLELLRENEGYLKKSFNYEEYESDRHQIF